MMRAHALNWHDCGNYTEITDLSSNIFSTDKDESKHIIGHKNLSHNCSAKNDKSKQSIVNKTLSQNYSADVHKICSIDIDKSEYTITEKKTKGMRLHMMCLIITYLTYLNVEETILMCHMKERTWPLHAMNTSQTLLTI